MRAGGSIPRISTHVLVWRMVFSIRVDPVACFESELLDLKAQLPHGASLDELLRDVPTRTISTGVKGSSVPCSASGDCKEEYLSVKTKDDFIKIFDENAGNVQETGICPQFSPGRPNTAGIGDEHHQGQETDLRLVFVQNL